MSELAFTVIGQPIAKQRPRVTRKHGNTLTYTPTKTRQYEKHVGFCAAMSLALWRREHTKPWPVKAEFRVTLRLFMGNLRRRDIDNCAKSILDGMKALWDDDSQVAELNVVKELDRACPRAEVTVRAL